VIGLWSIAVQVAILKNIITYVNVWGRCKMKRLILILLLLASNLQAQTVETFWIYQHLQDGETVVSCSSDIRCVDTTFAPYPLTELTWEADTVITVACARQSVVKSAELHAILPAGEYAVWSTYEGGKWHVIFHSHYDADGDGDIDLKDFVSFADRARIDTWNADRQLDETECFKQLYGKNPEFEWRE